MYSCFPLLEVPKMISPISRPSITAICIGLYPDEIHSTLKSLEAISPFLDEVIVIDSSCDGFNPELIPADLKANIIRQYPPQGISQSFNQAVRHANSDYLVFYNSGDECLADGFLQSYEALYGNQDLWMVAGPVILKDLYSSRLWHPRMKGNQIFQVHHIGTLYRRDLHRLCGEYDLSMRCAMDYSFLRRVLSAASRDQIFLQAKPTGTFMIGGVSTQLYFQKFREVLSADVMIDGKVVRPILHYIRSYLKGLASVCIRKIFGKLV